MAFPYNSQLDAFELYHKIVEEDARSQKPGVGLPALGHALAGSAGTAISHLVLYPLDLSITRLQVQKQLRGANEAPSAASGADIEYKDIFDAVGKIYRGEGGIRAFYAGCLTDTAKSIVDSFLFFLLYTFLRQRRLQSLSTRTLPVPDELRIGIAAGAFSKFITTPISQIVTRKQTAAMVAARDPTSSSPPERSSSSLSIRDIALQIRTERGITGFWAGYRASIVLTLNPALTFLFQNLLSRTLLPAARRDRPGPKMTFLIAALSKAAASATMYPFSLAKARAQISASHPTSPVVVSDDEKGTLSDAATREGSPSGVRRPGSDGSSVGISHRTTQSVRYVLSLLVHLIKSPGPLTQRLRDIYREEGFVALYSGLQGEVLKGFLGHGLTMLLKERIHLAIVGAYFVALKAARRSQQSNQGIRQDVVDEMGRVARAIGDGVDAVEDVVKEGAEKVVAKMRG